MKRFFILFATVVFCGLNILAEERVIFCEQFEYISGGASEADMIKVRSAALKGISESDRATFIDATKSEIGIRRGNTTEEIVERRQAIKALGATHIMEGRVNSCITKHETVKIKDKNSNKYTTTINYTITLTTIESGEQKIWNFENSYDGYDDKDHVYSQAIEKVYYTVYGNLRYYWPLYAHVLDEGFSKNGNKMKTCCISLGTADKVKVGNYFYVYEVTQIAGEQVKSKIGEIKITAVIGKHVSRCEVKKGEKEILTAMNNYFNIKQRNPEQAIPLQIKSDVEGDTIWEKITYTAGGVAALALGTYAAFLEELGGEGTTTE